MKLKKLLAAGIPVLALLSACGGGSGGGGGPITPPPALPTPKDPLTITAANANAVIALDARLTEVLVDLSSLILDNVVSLAESGQTTVTLPCDRGNVLMTLTDVNGNGLPGTNESASLNATGCENFDLRYAFTGVVDMEFRSFVLDPNTAAKTKIRATVTTPMQLTDGPNEISLSGALEIDALYDSSIQTLKIYQRFGDDIVLRTVNADGDKTDTYSDFTITRGLSGTGELSKTVALKVESETVTGTFSCSSPTRLIAVLNDIPDSGQLRCSGANSSAVRADSTGNGAVDVVVDPEGDGSFVDAGIIAGGQGTWNDFFDPSLFAITFSVPGTIPPQVVVPINSTMAAYSVNDIATNPSGNRLYISDDTGIRVLDGATLAELNYVALADVPGPLAVSDDGTRLWYGVKGAAEIGWLNLPNLSGNTRIPLNNNRRALHMRVVPGDATTAVVSMTNNSEIIAYSGTSALPNIVSSASAPVTFEFLDATTIVGINPAAADHPAASATLGATGLSLGTVRSQFDIDSGVAIAKTGLIGLGAVNPALVSNSGRVFDVLEGTVFGRLKLNQTESTTGPEGVAVNSATGDIFIYNSGKGLIESYKDTLLLRGAYRLFVNGTFLRLLEAGNRMVFASDSEIHVVPKSALNGNRNNSQCQPFDLSNQIVFGFFVQIDCGVFDVIYNQTQNVLYALLPSYSGVNGNSIARIDAATGDIVSRVYVGSEPERMVITPDDTRAYITLGESNRIAIVDLSGGNEVLEGYIDLEPYNQNVPQFARAIAVSPTDNNVLLVGANARVSVYDNGTRLGNVVAGAAIGNPRDLFFVDTNNAISQVPNGTISRLNVGNNGVTLGTQTSNAAAAGSLKVQDGKVYDHDGRVLDATNLNLLGACSTGVGMGGLLVDPSETSNRVYYIDQSVDSVFTICSDSTYTQQKIATIPAFGDVGGMPQDLEEMGDGRVALTAGDILLLFDADAI